MQNRDLRPEFTIHWYLFPQLIRSSDNKHILVNALLALHAGIFRCSVAFITVSVIPKQDTPFKQTYLQEMRPTIGISLY